MATLKKRVIIQQTKNKGEGYAGNQGHPAETMQTGKENK